MSPATSSVSATSESHLQFWNSQKAVRQYTFSSRPAFLYPPELPLLGLLRDRWAQVDMLDIGVGAGRTAQYFAELCRTYVGIDFASEMIGECKRRFTGRWPGAEFRVGDASDLRSSGDGSYDLVLFSFNGIDCMPYEQRQRALGEMCRVCRPGGYVVFSSHNSYRIPFIPQFEFQRHPLRFLEEIRRWWQVRRWNPPVEKAMAEEHVGYYDGNTGANRLMFIRPAQVQELSRMGLEVIGRYANDGRPVPQDEDVRDPAISWVYYYCRKP